MRRIPAVRPTVEIVIRRALMPSPSAAVACAKAGSRRSRLASGSPMPITTMWLRRSSARSSRWSCNICSRISPRERLRTTPSMPLAQKAQCDRAADLRADANGAVPAVVAQEHAFGPLAVAQFQEELFRAVGGSGVGGDAAVQIWKSAANCCRSGLGRSLIASKSAARFSNSHRRTWPSRYAGMSWAASQACIASSDCSRKGSIGGMKD